MITEDLVTCLVKRAEKTRTSAEIATRLRERWPEFRDSLELEGTAAKQDSWGSNSNAHGYLGNRVAILQVEGFKKTPLTHSCYKHRAFTGSSFEQHRKCLKLFPCNRWIVDETRGREPRLAAKRYQTIQQGCHPTRGNISKHPSRAEGIIYQRIASAHSRLIN